MRTICWRAYEALLQPPAWKWSSAKSHLRAKDDFRAKDGGLMTVVRLLERVAANR